MGTLSSSNPSATRFGPTTSSDVATTTWMTPCCSPTLGATVDGSVPVVAVREWGLRTEPWLFLVGADGKIVNRYEGGITVEEIQPDVEKLVR